METKKLEPMVREEAAPVYSPTDELLPEEASEPDALVEAVGFGRRTTVPSVTYGVAPAVVSMAVKAVTTVLTAVPVPVMVGGSGRTRAESVTTYGLPSAPVVVKT